jgi:hypothetical protein
VAEDQKIDATKFEPLYRAGKNFVGAVDVGINYQKFTDLLQAMASELSIATDKVNNEKEKQLLALYAEAFSAYKDCGTLWDYKIKDAGSYSGYILFDMSNQAVRVKNRTSWRYREVLVPIVQKYNLFAETKSSGSGGLLVGGDVDYKVLQGDQAVQAVMSAAGKLLEPANKMYLAAQESKKAQSSADSTDK